MTTAKFFRLLRERTHFFPSVSGISGHLMRFQRTVDTSPAEGVLARRFFGPRFNPDCVPLNTSLFGHETLGQTSEVGEIHFMLLNG